MKTILIIAPYLPYPLNSGGTQALFHMIEGIRSHYCIHFMTQICSKQEPDLKTLKNKWPNVVFHAHIDLKSDDEVYKPLYYRIINKIQKSLSRKLKRFEKSTCDDYVRKNSLLDLPLYEPLKIDFIEYFSRVISENKFDLIQVEFFEMLSLGYLIPIEQQSLIVIHEPRWIRNEREINLFDKVTIKDRYTYRVAKDYELGCIKSFKHIITLSEIDKIKLLVELPNSNIYNSPAAITLPKNSIIKKTSPTDNSLIFVGGSSHFPNNDGLTWFCKEIAPNIKSDFTLKVTGHWDKKTQLHLLKHLPTIQFVGFVDDLEAELSKSISIVPIRIGGGIRMKIIEAAQSFSPFIATTCGVEGLDFEHNQECLIADNAVQFANEIDRLLNDFSLQTSISEKAFNKISEKNNSINPIERRMDIYNKILS